MKFLHIFLVHVLSAPFEDISFGEGHHMCMLKWITSCYAMEVYISNKAMTFYAANGVYYFAEKNASQRNLC